MAKWLIYTLQLPPLRHARPVRIVNMGTITIPTTFCGYCGRKEFDCTCPDAEKTPRMDDLELARFALDEESPTLGPPPIPKPGPPPKQPPKTETEVQARVQKMSCYFCGASAEQRLASSKQLICRRCLDTLFVD